MRTVETNLLIRTEASTVRGFIAALNEGVSGGWTSTPIALKRVKPYDELYISYTYTGDERSNVHLVLNVKRDGSLASQEVWAESWPEETISIADQSSFWKDFYSQAKPIAEARGIEIAVSGAPVDADEILDEPEMRLLRCLGFRTQAIESLIGNEDWREFLAETHRKRSELSEDDLRDWLMSKGWDGRDVEILARSYDFGRALLRHYDERRDCNSARSLSRIASPGPR